MFFSIFVYALVLVLLFYGVKVVKPSANQNLCEQVFTADTSKCLQGICALCVILHHLSQNKAFSQNHVIGFFEQIGFLFVAVFFFCSGFGLIRSLNTKSNYLDGFVKKRIVPILIAFFVMNLIYAFYRFVSGAQLPVAQWITGILGLVLLNDQAWYVVVILIMYTIFYISFKHIKNRKISFAIILISILLQGVFFCIMGHFAWWSQPDSWQKLLRGGQWWQSFVILWYQGEWWVNSSIAFFVGMVVANNFEKLLDFLSKKYWLKFIVLLLICAVTFELASLAQWKISYWSEFSGKLGIGNKFICYFAQMSFVIPFVLMLFMITYKIQIGNKVMRYLGGLSLELYLMQLIPITVWAKIVMKKEYLSGDNGIWYMILYSVLVILTTYVLAIIYRWIHKRITSLID